MGNCIKSSRDIYLYSPIRLDFLVDSMDFKLDWKSLLFKLSTAANMEKHHTIALCGQKCVPKIRLICRLIWICLLGDCLSTNSITFSNHHYGPNKSCFQGTIGCTPNSVPMAFIVLGILANDI